MRRENALAFFEAQQQQYKDNMLVAGKMSINAFQKIDALRCLVVEYPEHCHRLAPLISLPKVKVESVQLAMRLGRNIARAKKRHEVPRETTLLIYETLVSNIITVAKSHPPEFLIGLVFGDKTDKIMASYDSADELQDSKAIGDVI